MATPRAGSLPGTVSGAGGELGWLVTSRKPRDEIVDAEDDVDGLVVVDDCSASWDPPAFPTPVYLRGAMMQATGLNAERVWLKA